MNKVTKKCLVSLMLFVFFLAMTFGLLLVREIPRAQAENPNGYVKEAVVKGLEEEHWGTVGTGEMMTSDPIFNAFSEGEKYSMPIQNIGSFNLYAGYQGGSAKYFSVKNGYGFSFAMDFGDGDFNGCLYFGINETAVGIFDDKIAIVGWANNNGSTVDGRFAAYGKTYAGVQSITIKLECIYSDAGFTTPTGKMYTLVVGNDTYSFYYNSTGFQNDKFALANYTNEVIDLYAFNYAEEDVNKPNGYVKEAVVKGLEEEHWGTVGAGEMMTSDPICNAFSAGEKYSMPIGTNDGRQLFAGYHQSSMKYVSSKSSFGYKFKMDFGDGDFTGCVNFKIGDALGFGIFDDKIANTTSWDTNVAHATRFATYDKTYTGIQDVVIKYECVFSDADYKTPTSKMITLTIGTDEYSYYYDNAYHNDSKPLSFNNNTNEVIDLYAFDYVEKFVKEAVVKGLEEEHWGTVGAGEMMTSDPVCNAFSAGKKYSMPIGTNDGRQLFAGYHQSSMKYVSSKSSFGYKFKMDFNDGDFTGCINFKIGDALGFGIFDDRIAATTSWDTNVAHATRFASYDKTYTGIQDVVIKYECVFSDAEYTTPTGKMVTITIGADEYSYYYDNTYHNNGKALSFNNNTNEVIDFYKYGENVFRGCSISLNGDIAINYYVILEPSVISNPNSKFVFTREDGTTSSILVSDAEHVGNEYKFAISLPAKSVNEKVIGQVVVDENKGFEYPYSVKDYIDYQLDNSSDENLKALLNSLMVYGSAAEAYFNGSVVADVNTDIDYTSKTSVSGSDDNINLVGATLVLESKTAIRIYFTLEEGINIDEVDCSFGLVGNVSTATTPILKNVDTNLYYVEISVVAKNLSSEYSIVIGDYVINYCALDYIKTVDVADTNLYNLVKSLYVYSASADVYFASNN